MMYNLSPELMEFIIKNSAVAISITDKHGYIILFNEKHKEFSGDFNEKYIGMNMSELVETGVLNASSTLKVIETGKPMVLEQIVYPGTKNEMIFLAKSIPYHDENGELQYIVSYLLNINDKYKLIKELEKAQFNNERYILELQQIRNEMISTSPIIYRSNAMRNIIERAEKIAKTDASVLIIGETGTGKNLLAKYIHTQSSRSESSFLTINCGAIPKNLIESELFGYEKGAFSGANSTGKKGIFEYADGGTLLLDEIGEMPYDVQVKLLGVLQNGEFYRVGGAKSIKVNVRIIAATNANLISKIEQHLFREDLYYRLNVISFRIPPLRERCEDIPILIEHICSRNNEKYNFSKVFAPNAVNQLMRMKLYGNVRELENIIERNILFSLSDVITDIDLYEESKDEPGKVNISHNQIIKRQEVDAEVEKEALINAYLKYGTTTAMAKHFGVSQPTISRKLRQHGICKYTLLAGKSSDDN